MENTSFTPTVQPISKLKTFHGVLLALLCAVAAEFILGSLIENVESRYSTAGRISLCFLTIYTIHRFALTSLNEYSPRFKDLICLALVLIGSFGLIWLGKILNLGLSQYLSNYNINISLGSEAFVFAIPFAAGALLMQAVLGLHFGLLYSITLAIIMGIYSYNFIAVTPFVLSTSLMGCLSLSRFRSRSAYIRAGFNIALVSLPFALAAVILSGATELMDLLLPLAAALFGGILCAFVASGATPILEALGGYVTDMRLLEMATLDHPLLKEVSIQAPGTWNHSMVMGMMVETAASEIGANSVLARVGAYFHDIGKMKKPLYFVENQGGGENRHDKLSCSMSALIIRSHVKDGIELAKKHKLPQTIIDMIPQHHGTSLIEYFYEKAKKEVAEIGEDAPPVDKSLYSYPGPKPQTREAGILMLADGIEASVRTISEPSPDRIQGLVQKMINKVFASGQLNECELTLRDLHLIAKSFTRVLTSIYHQRVAYAEPAEKGNVSTSESKKAEQKSDEKDVKKEKAKNEKESKEEKKSSQSKAETESTNNGNGKENSNGDKPEETDSIEDTGDRKEDLKRLGIQ